MTNVCESNALKMLLDGDVTPAHCLDRSDSGVSSLPPTGQSFYSRVLENCEAVANFDEVGCLRSFPQTSLAVREQKGTNIPPCPLGCTLAPNPSCWLALSNSLEGDGRGGGYGRASSLTAPHLRSLLPEEAHEA
jgi:hypothetical protein